jgi:hypothetical protein
MLASSSADLQMASYQHAYPRTANVGFFHARGNKRTASLFQLLHSKVLSALATFRDNTLLESDCEALLEHEFNQCLRDDGCRPEGLHSLLLDPNYVACHSTPTIIDSTVAIRPTLNETHCQFAEFRKEVVAKELQVWEGADGYYSSTERKYLIMKDAGSGQDSPEAYGPSVRVFRSQLSTMVPLAIALNRTLILSSSVNR